MTHFHICLLPFLANWYITPAERELLANCQLIRRFVAGIIEDRKLQTSTGGRDDLLDIMLADPLFRNSVDKTIDEILTIFFAGSQTSANVSQNLILHLCQHPEYKAKVIDEISTQNSELDFYTQCFNEAMRI